MTIKIVMLVCTAEMEQNGHFLPLALFLRVNMIFATMILNVKMTRCAGFRTKTIRRTISKLA